MTENERIDEVPVLVAGAGPAGLVVAATLGRHGIACLVVERRAEPSTLPRATVISIRSMELLRSWGLAERVRAGATEVDWSIWSSRTLADADAGSGTPVGIPSRHQAAMISPVAAECVPQDHLEPVLLDHVRSLPGVRVELGTEVADVAQDGDHVRVVLRGSATGTERVVRARYVVGADGAHSAVRAAIGVAMRGDDPQAHAASVTFRAPLWPVVGAHRHVLYGVTHPAATGAFLPVGLPDRWQYSIRWDAGSTAAPVTEERMRARILVASGVPDLDVRIERMGTFSFQARLADTFRRGRVFLVGDAAHQVTPRGGTGMNTAIRSGHDLAWKLAWVLQGWAHPDLLATYESERRPLVEHNVARSIDPDGSTRDIDEVHVDLGGRLAHRWLPGATRRSTLDLLGPGFTVITAADRGPWERSAPRLAVAAPVAVHRVDVVTARALGVVRDGAILVRPDGTIAGWFGSSAGAAAALRAAVAATVGPAAAGDDPGLGPARSDRTAA